MIQHARVNEIPAEGSKVWVQGHEFIATGVTIHIDHGDPRWPRDSDGRHVLRFKGICTGHKDNDSIRHTGYNGETYGWSVNPPRKDD